MNDPNLQFSPDDPIADTAARWIARRDRGLTESEQAAYAQWLAQDPRHAAAMTRPEKSWAALDRLAHQFPVRGNTPNPDLLAPPRSRHRWIWIPALAAAAAVALIYFARSPVGTSETITYSNPGHRGGEQAIVRHEPERHILADGSVVELNEASEVRVNYTRAERRVQLVRGEAYFVVAKNPQRPFLVSADSVTVRAVGTAFRVGLGQQGLSVLVTEGKVRVDDASISPNEKPAAPRELSALVAGQQGVFDLKPPAAGTALPPMKVSDLTPAETDRALAWRGLQLEFTNLPLRDAVAEFNRYNRQKLVIADAETGAIRVGGLFRADNVAAFVSLIDLGFGVSASPHDQEIVLHKTHGR